MKFILRALLAMCLMVVTQVSYAETIKTDDGRQPFVRWVVYQGTPEHIEQIADIRDRYAAQCQRSEDGVYAMYGGIDEAAPGIYRGLEIYRDARAFDMFSQSEAYKAYTQEIQPLLQKEIVLDADAFLLESKQSGQAHMVRMARLVIDPDKLDEYKQALYSEIIGSVTNEPGVMALLATTETANPHIFHLLEIYENEEAYEQHISGSYFQAYNKAVQQIVQDKSLIVNKEQNVSITWPL